MCVGVLALSACGGASEPAASSTTSNEEAHVDAPVVPPLVPVERGTIARGRLDEVLAQGLGSFLQHVVTEPHLEEGRFVGFRLRELDQTLFAGVDLVPGDTLVRVNGSAIERPEQALTVWNGLRVASELTLEYLREGELRRLRFEIAD